MPITLPRTVREALGEEAATDFTEWFELLLRERPGWMSWNHG